jgi:diguanylate cyclase (GGDEF)-like protein/PAS domain S-box-containing protein
MESSYIKKETMVLDRNGEQKIKYHTEKKLDIALRDALLYAESIISTVREPLIVLDSNLKVISANKSFYRKFKDKKEDIIGKFFYQISGKIWDSTKLRILLEEIIPQKNYFEDFELDLTLKNAGKRAMLLNARQLDDTLEYKKLILIAIEDITDRRKLENAINIKLSALMNSTSDSFALFSNNLELIEANKVFLKKMKEWYGLGKKQLMGKKFSEIIHNFKITESYKKLTQVQEDGKPLSYEDILPDTRSGKIHLDIKAFRLDSGVGIMFSDITEKKKSEEWLKYLSFHDKLTGLYNRAFFEEEMERLNSRRQLPISIIMGDINGLKLINDTFGHVFGDKLLKTAAKVLKAACRNEDIVARLGGDEFVILLPKNTSSDAAKLVDRIREKNKRDDRKKLPLNIALGISTKEDLNKDIKTMMNEAEDKMNQRKLFEADSTVASMINLLQISSKEKNYKNKGNIAHLKKIAILLGTIKNLPAEELDKFVLLAALHDIGKIAIAGKILNKKEKLTNKEWEILKKHSEIGNRIALASPQLDQIAKEILFSHEWWDGEGYPKGLKEKSIPLLSRMLSIIDAYEAMIEGRPYRKAKSRNEAIKELKKCAGTQFDPSLVNTFIKLIKENKNL